MSLRGQVRVACEALGDSTALQIIFEGREQAAYPIMMMVQMTAARELFRDNVHGMSGQVQAQKQRGRRSHPSSSDASCRRSSTSVMFMASVVKVGAMLFGKVGRLRMCGGGGVGDGGVWGWELWVGGGVGVGGAGGGVGVGVGWGLWVVGGCAKIRPFFSFALLHLTSKVTHRT